MIIAREKLLDIFDDESQYYLHKIYSDQISDDDEIHKFIPSRYLDDMYLNMRNFYLKLKNIPYYLRIVYYIQNLSNEKVLSSQMVLYYAEKKMVNINAAHYKLKMWYEWTVYHDSVIIEKYKNVEDLNELIELINKRN